MLGVDSAGGGLKGDAIGEKNSRDGLKYLIWLLLMTKSLILYLMSEMRLDLGMLSN